MRVLLALLLVGIAGCGGQETLTLKGHLGSVWSVSFSPDGKRIVSGGGEYNKPGEIKVWDISRRRTRDNRSPAASEGWGAVRIWRVERRGWGGGQRP
jgi:WD40 repeat protein